MSTITAVRIVGVPEQLAATLRGRLVTRPGMAMAEAPIREDLRRLWATGVLADASVDVLDDQEVVFAVVPRSRIRRVVVAGGDSAMARRFRWLEGAAFEPARLTRMATALETHYIRSGHVDASIVARAAPTLRGIDVCVAANIGPRVTISSLKFPGSSAIAEHELIAALRGADSKINRIGGTLDPEALEHDKSLLEERYWDHGYMRVHIGAPKVVRRGREVDVTIPISEGAVFRLGAVTTGAPITVPFGLSPGVVFSRTKFMEAREKLRHQLDAEDIEVVSELDEAARRLDFKLTIRWRWPWDALRALRLSPR